MSLQRPKHAREWFGSSFLVAWNKEGGYEFDFEQQVSDYHSEPIPDTFGRGWR